MKPTSAGFARPPRSPHSRVDNPSRVLAEGPPPVPSREASLRAGQHAPAANVPANPTPATNLPPPEAHQPPPINLGAGNLACEADDANNPVLRMKNPFAAGQTTAAPHGSNPFQQKVPSPGDLGFGNPFVDNNGVPQIFEPQPAPAGPAAADANPPPGARPAFVIVNGDGSHTHIPASANNPFVNGDGSLPTPPIPYQPWSLAGAADPTNPFFAGASTAACPPPSAADTAKAGIEHQVQFGVFCMAMHELILRECVKQGLPPSAVQPLLDLFLDNGVTAIDKSQSLAASAALGGNAQPVDTQAIKASALARQADSAKQVELTRLQMEKNQLPPDDQPTFDPLTKRNGRRTPITPQPPLEKLDSSTSSGTSTGSSTGSTSSASQVKIPNPDDADDAGESSSTDDEIEISQTQSDDTSSIQPQPVAKPQPKPVVQPVAQPQPVVKPSPVATPTPVKPQNPNTDDRVPRQQYSFQDDLAQVNRKKNEQLKSDLANEQTLAIADLKRQLDQADQQTREALLKLSKHRQSERHKQATHGWSLLYAKKTAGTATDVDVAHMDEFDTRSTAALDHEKAIKTLAATYGIAL